MDDPIYTIGHSDHPIGTFLELLKKWGVKEIADVRSAPYSKRYPQYSKSTLEGTLERNGISYVFLGKELGARPADGTLYVNGKADYRLISSSPAFMTGIRLLARRRTLCRIAVMCSEKEPLNCHRTLLVSRALGAEKIPVVHILADGTAENHEKTLKRLLQLHGREDERDLFLSPEELLDAVYRLQERKIACSKAADRGMEESE